MCKTLKLLQRVAKIWFATFSLRIWRSWLLKEESYNLEVNFVSANSYSCLEILAHAIVLTIGKLRDEGTPHLFLPCSWLFTSQPCEIYFCAARSFSSTESTQANFSLKVVTLCPRIYATIQISAKGIDVGVEYPFQNKVFEQTCIAFVPSILPSYDEIENIIKDARIDTKKNLSNLVKQTQSTYKDNLMNLFKNWIRYSSKKQCSRYDERQASQLSIDQQKKTGIKSDQEMKFPDDNEILKSINTSHLKKLIKINYPANSPENLEQSIFAYLRNESGISKMVKKWSIVWVLEMERGD